MILIAGTCIINEDKILLLQQLENGEQANAWGPPAGHGNPNEILTDIAVRETKEETNLDVKLKFLINVTCGTHKGSDYLIVHYLADPVDLSQLRIDPKEVANYVWATKDEIASDKYEFRSPFLKTVFLQAFEPNHSDIDRAVYLGEV